MSLSSRLVLIVDDDPDVCWALDHVLQGLGVRCVRALDGRTALQLVRLNRLTLVLLDAKLPDIDGLELAQHIRIAQPGIPIMVISGYFYKDDPAILAALEQGLIHGFIEKPFLHAEVVETVKDALSSQQPGSRTVRRTVGGVGEEAQSSGRQTAPAAGGEADGLPIHARAEARTHQTDAPPGEAVD